MKVTDPIADLYTRLRNANAAKHASFAVPSSKMKKAILKVLLDEGYIAEVQVLETKTPCGEKAETLKVRLKYGLQGEPLINQIQQVSKSGCRAYRGQDELSKVLDGLGIGVVSTSRGVMSDRDARKLKIGGELLVRVW